jgi:hypothetical protein
MHRTRIEAMQRRCWIDVVVNSTSSRLRGRRRRGRLVEQLQAGTTTSSCTMVR